MKISTGHLSPQPISTEAIPSWIKWANHITVTSANWMPWLISTVHCRQTLAQCVAVYSCDSRLILGLCPANERRRYFVTTSLIGWTQAYNRPCVFAATIYPSLERIQRVNRSAESQSGWSDSNNHIYYWHSIVPNDGASIATSLNSGCLCHMRLHNNTPLYIFHWWKTL